MGSAAAQARLWGRDPQTWATTMEQFMHPLYSATLDALAPLDGQRLLDAGCGAGQALSDAWARGAGATGIDATEALVTVARRRTPSADVRTGDIEELPWESETFDVVTAFNAVQYAVDPAQAVGELARVCRPGGRVAIGVWGEPAACETDGLFARLRALAPPPPGTPAPLALSDAGVVEELLTKAALDVVSGARVPVPITFATLEQAWRAHASAGPVQKVIDTVGEEATRRVLEQVLTADRKPDGMYRQDNVMRYVIAIKP